MITLYSYPELFGVADNNGYGLKVFAFLRLNGVPFRHEHVFDASAAPRGQLPYIVDDGETIGDSDTIIAHVIAKDRLTMDAALTARQRDMSHLITRMLDDLAKSLPARHAHARAAARREEPARRDPAESAGTTRLCARQKSVIGGPRGWRPSRHAWRACARAQGEPGQCDRGRGFSSNTRLQGCEYANGCRLWRHRSGRYPPH